jgi:uncharacterized FlaG/YvyC family protein
MTDIDCELLRVFSDDKMGIIAIDIIDNNTGKEIRLMTKDLVIDKLEKGFPL